MQNNLKASRRSGVDAFLAMDVMSAANKLEAEGHQILHMELGQPGAPAPKPVLEAARRMLEDGRLGYTEAMGIPDLRTAISGYYKRHFAIDVPESRVMITTGSSAGFNLAFLAGFDAGDRIALTAPGYPAYRNIIKALGLVPVEIEVGPDTRWSLTAERLREEHAKAPLKGVLIASPANPTGTMMTPDALRSLVEACDELGIWFISDEIYHGLAFSMEEETALRFSQNAIIINSFSKYYCMTGWRIGWMVLPEALVRPVERIAQSLYISPPALSQVAAAAAFDATEELEVIKQGYARNREILLSGLPAAGFEELLPVDGAFYVYANTRRFSNDSKEFCQKMLQETHIAATPGADFDLVRGAGYMRFSFAGPTDHMQLAMDRLKDWLR
ncbi:pyridoxal phosphate-dependent aminotransferase [Pseudovibrio flavus]|uniref:pyridoxal phosphate-dependent aminotransferase n=1 Tax=Pseudovibrio flavus TaxID=2529854 RepID=UPI00211B8AD8|nr:aminotransferase class I/II-fold pyridoxal phosphate-dependent enzyme [Pseudovibrio flavus]